MTNIVPLYPIPNRLKSNWEINNRVIGAILKYSTPETFIEAGAIRVHEIDQGLTVFPEQDNADIPGLLEGMKVLGCKDPEKLVNDITPTFEREYMAPSGRELDW